MGKNCNKIKQTCTGNRQQAECVDYQGTVNTQSELFDENCLTISETTQDIYNQLEEIDLTALGNRCLQYVVTPQGKKIVKNTLLKFEEEICDLKTEIAELKKAKTCDIDLSCCELNFWDLVDACGNQPTKLCEVIQLILTKIKTP